MGNIEMQVLRVALQPRVSTDEQVRHGDSLDAQEKALIQYANEHNMKIVGIYRDEGHSARKPVLKRPVMLELLEDVKAGKIDLILFTKLDRWFRNVGEYHAIQAILDKHNVTWQAILEDYNTTTADGRLKVNIMLSVAENEADRTSERIKFVFEAKRAKKEAFFPLPWGYKKEKIDGVSRIIKDPETQHIVEYFFRQALATSIRQAVRDINSKFGLSFQYATILNDAKNELYTGSHRGIEGYAPPYITKEEFDVINSRNLTTRKTENNRIYVFSTLIRCPKCGRRLAGAYSTSRGIEYFAYRCSKYSAGACNFRNISEKKIEKYLLENLRKEMELQLLDAEEKQLSKKNSKSKESEIEKLQETLRRTNVAYFAGNMTDEEYEAKTNAIKNQILLARLETASAETSIDTEAIKAFLATDFESIYKILSREEKRSMWQSVIDEILLDGTTPIGIKLKL